MCAKQCLREAEKEFGINYRKLARYVKRRNPSACTFECGTPGKILSENIENDLVEYTSGWSACKNKNSNKYQWLVCLQKQVF